MIFPAISEHPDTGIQIHEIVLPDKSTVFRRNTQTIGGKATPKPTRKGDKVRMRHEIFELESFAYSIDKERMAGVDVYVEIGVLSKFDDAKDRYRAIEDFIRCNAAWFFTYGLRQFTPDPTKKERTA